uniref:hypothetical protein n=1 Tax=Flavobacterium sp. TaxID=239 RepID=UPI00404B1636
MKGLKVKKQYEDLIGVAVSDKLYNIKFPNRDAKHLRDGFVLSQLDSLGMTQMEKQQEMASKEAYKEHLLKEITKNTGANIHDLRNDNHDDMRRARVDNALYFDMSHDDDVSLSTEAGVQTQANTNESGVQAKAESSSSGVQAKAESSSSGFQTKPTLNRSNTKKTQATEDKSEEIEKLKRTSELEKVMLKEQHKNNIERVIQQARAESELAHENRKQEYYLEAMHRVNITEVEAQRRIQQIQQSAQQEAQHYVGNLINFAEVQHQSQMAAAKEKAEKSEHDIEHKSQRSPNTRAKAKQKADDTPLNQVPPFPTSERATGSQDRTRYNVHPNDNVNPESTHEPKGPPGRPSNTQPKPKAKSKGPNIKKDAKNKQEQPPPNNNPAHDTEKDENKKPSYWNKKGLGYLKDQLNKRGFRTTHKPNGKKLLKPDYLEEVLRMIAAGRW